MSNPLLDTSSLPRFDELAPDQVVPALSELIAEHRQKLEALLDNNPVIQRSIRDRNPDTDLINAMQVELLRRWREAAEDTRPALRTAILLSVNALAAAMQSTG